MGTFVEIAIGGRDASLDDHARNVAMRAAFDAVGRVASSMSFHDPASDLSRLNAAPPGVAVRVDPWMLDVLAEARRLFDASAGLFDPTIGADLVARGVLPRHRDAATVDDATFDDIALLDDGRVMRRRAVCLDLGGIAKGAAVDRAIDALRDHGVRSAVVNAGGDLRVLGPDAVPIHVHDVERGRRMPAGLLAEGAFATSSAYRPRADAPAQSPSAIVDPRRRRVVDARQVWSVVAPTCVLADALTKVVAVAGALAAAPVLRAFDAVSQVCEAA